MSVAECWHVHIVFWSSLYLNVVFQLLLPECCHPGPQSSPYGPLSFDMVQGLKTSYQRSGGESLSVLLMLRKRRGGRFYRRTAPAWLSCSWRPGKKKRDNHLWSWDMMMRIKLYHFLSAYIIQTCWHQWGSSHKLSDTNYKTHVLVLSLMMSW